MSRFLPSAVSAVAGGEDRTGEQSGGEAAGQDAVLTWSFCSLPAPKASSPMSKDTVNPILTSSASPRTSSQVRSSSRLRGTPRCQMA